MYTVHRLDEMARARVLPVDSVCRSSELSQRGLEGDERSDETSEGPNGGRHRFRSMMLDEDVHGQCIITGTVAHTVTRRGSASHVKRRSPFDCHHGPADGVDKLPLSLVLHERHVDPPPSAHPTTPPRPLHRHLRAEPTVRATSSTDYQHVAHQPHCLALRLLPTPRGGFRRTDWPLRLRLSDVLAVRGGASTPCCVRAAKE